MKFYCNKLQWNDVAPVSIFSLWKYENILFKDQINSAYKHSVLIYALRKYEEMSVPIFTSQFLSFIFHWKFVIKANRINLVYNPFHNILRHFDVLPNFSFRKTEMMGDYYL